MKQSGTPPGQKVKFRDCPSHSGTVGNYVFQTENCKSSLHSPGWHAVMYQSHALRNEITEQVHKTAFLDYSCIYPVPLSLLPAAMAFSADCGAYVEK